MSEDKLAMKTKDGIAANIEALKRLFPEVVSEGKIDFEQLKTIMGENVAGDERYTFTWAGKRAAMIEAAKPITKTLRPCPAESKDWDKTQNIYIEGDNLDALKILQNTYFGKVKMIYIDPPYNTGKDFIYHDNFHGTKTAEAIKEGDVDAETGMRYRQNTGSNGYYHSDWCSMMYPRLKLARNLLRDDGVIFISIGQDEVENVIKIGKELFGEINHIANISRVMKRGGNKGEFFSPNIEYIVVFSKDRESLTPFRELLTEEIIKTYNHVEKEGQRKGEKFSISGLCRPGLEIRPNQRYWVECPDGTLVIPRGVTFPKKHKDGEKVMPVNEDICWRWSDARYIEEKQKGNIFFAPSKSAEALIDENGKTSKWNVFIKTYLSDRMNEGKVPSDLITNWENRVSSVELKELNIPFDFAKPSQLIKHLLSLLHGSKDSIILDFFSGSATTAHAVMKLNAEDGGKRKFIMVQLPEECPEGSEAAKAGYKNICEIGKERIRRAGEKIKEESPLTTQDLDVGFRVFKVDSSNMKDVFYNPNEVKQNELNKEVINIKDDRSGLDLLYGCLLDWGLPIDSPLEVKKINGNDIFVVDGMIMACFEQYVDKETIEEMAKLKPDFVLFRELAFDWSASKINAKEIFKTYSPNTKMKVL